MTWITPEKEIEIRSLLSNSKMPNRVIAKEVGVATNTVRNMRLAMRLLDSWSDDMKSEAQSLLVSGLPVGAVSVRMNIALGEVEAFVYVNRRGVVMEGVSTCGICGAITLSPKKRYTIRKNSTPPDDINKENVGSLYNTVETVLQLNDMASISDPLFHSLAHRAERLISKINGKEKT